MLLKSVTECQQLRALYGCSKGERRPGSGTEYSVQGLVAPKEPATYVRTKTCTGVLMAALFLTAQTRK